MGSLATVYSAAAQQTRVPRYANLSRGSKAAIDVTNPLAAEHAITHDPAYEAVPPDDFAAMVAVGRYPPPLRCVRRIIGATHDHFWDPHNPAYLDLRASR